ncbi:hypothetical protein DFJ73DRAFT_124516 [Zopfochytrium polystomum]|nr:hypothetical protein DFJ73DRAFT_124516 [Zopfochytrium polystomum]
MSKKEAAEKTLDEVTAEVYEAKVRDLLEKLQRYKDKCELLLSENDALTKAQTKFSYDKQDIVEFLNIKVHEHEEHITQLESKLSDLEEAKRDQELKAKSDFEAATLEWKSELDQCQTQSARYKAELDQLSDFKERKEDMENQLRRALVALEVKEKEYKDSIHSMERKMLQDKSQMKKEMLQKVNEAVANFRRVADQQMAEVS